MSFPPSGGTFVSVSWVTGIGLHEHTDLETRASNDKVEAGRCEPASWLIFVLSQTASGSVPAACPP
jgi:hypothetical protein